MRGTYDLLAAENRRPSPDTEYTCASRRGTRIFTSQDLIKTGRMHPATFDGAPEGPAPSGQISVDQGSPNGVQIDVFKVAGLGPVRVWRFRRGIYLHIVSILKNNVLV